MTEEIGECMGKVAQLATKDIDFGKNNSKEDISECVEYRNDHVSVEYPNPQGWISIPEGDFDSLIRDRDPEDIIHSYHAQIVGEILTYKFLMSQRLVRLGKDPGYSLGLVEAAVNWLYNHLGTWQKEQNIQLTGLEKVIIVNENPSQENENIKHRFILIPTMDDYYDFRLKKQAKIVKKLKEAGTLTEEVGVLFAKKCSDPFGNCLLNAGRDFEMCMKKRNYVLICSNGEIYTKPLDSHTQDIMTSRGFYGLMDLDETVEKELSQKLAAITQPTQAQPLSS